MVKERCLDAYKEEKKKVKRCISEQKKKRHELFGKKMNQDVRGNRKYFWKEMRERWRVEVQ